MRMCVYVGGGGVLKWHCQMKASHLPEDSSLGGLCCDSQQQRLIIS